MTAATATRSPGALELFSLICDPGTFRSWDEALVPVPTSESYAADLDRARTRSGADESVLTGEGRIQGRRVALVASEFSFLGGSIGVAAAERLVRAIERATREGLPLLAGPASGGTRMQEGTVAFLAMVKISAAISRLKAARLPYLVYLRHPTTGGVMASWASLGHVTVAEPGALLGFLGPRVYEALHDEPFPSGVQSSENLLQHGLIDAILTPDRLPAIVARVLDLMLSPRSARPQDDAVAVDAPGPPTAGVWDSIERSRMPGRPGVRSLLREGAEDVLPLSGTGQGEHEPGVLLALARFGGEACVVVGQDRGPKRPTGPLGPGSLREARRGMRLAEQLGLPLVTVIDTAGAAMTREAEEGGLAGEIARCLADLVMSSTPTVSMILGQGTGGGALALLPADRTIAAQHAWLSPLPPEGASAILFHDLDHAEQMAEQQGVSADRLRRSGIVDEIVAELPDARDEPAAFCRRTGTAIADALRALTSVPADERLERRWQRYRQLGLDAASATSPTSLGCSEHRENHVDSGSTP